MTMLPRAVQTVRELSKSISGARGRNANRTFKLGTFNVRGLTKEVKQYQLGADMERYGLDVLCLQETKMQILLNKDINKNRLICTESVSSHYGLGFMVAPKWTEHIHRFWRVNDRISVLQLQTTQSKQQRKETYSSTLVGNRLTIRKSEPVDHMINIINVYAPTSEKVDRSREEIDVLYAQVEKLRDNFRKLKSAITLIAGDFNAKVGKKENEERCMGNHTTGRRNQSGRLLTEFCERNNLFIGNTAFKHPKRHITTWSQQRIEKNRGGTLKNVFNQIDYALIDNK